MGYDYLVKYEKRFDPKLISFNHNYIQRKKKKKKRQDFTVITYENLSR